MFFSLFILFVTLLGLCSGDNFNTCGIHFPSTEYGYYIGNFSLEQTTTVDIFQNIGPLQCEKQCMFYTRCRSTFYSREQTTCVLLTTVLPGKRTFDKVIQFNLGPCNGKVCDVFERCVPLKNGAAFCVFYPAFQQDCLALLEKGNTQSGVYNISVSGRDRTLVWCDMDTDGGGWTVFQRRIDGATDFYRGWDEYKNGFGDINHEFWLGNEKIHALTSAGDTELRVDLEDFHNNNYYAKYHKFVVGNAADDYRLNITGYTGDAGDSMEVHNGRTFSTYDHDYLNCSVNFQGAWWYNFCYDSHLNGLYLMSSDNFREIRWITVESLLKSTKMMMRRNTTTEG